MTGFPTPPRMPIALRRRPVWIPAAVAGVALALAIVNSALAFGFPDAAPVETIYNFGISVDLAAMALVLVVAAVLRSRRNALAVPDAQTPVMLRDGVPIDQAAPGGFGGAGGVLGAILAAVAVVAWSIFSGIGLAATLAFDEPTRYMNTVAAGFFFGVPWVLGVVFSTLGLHADAPARRRRFSAVGLALGAALAIPLVTAAAVYSAGLSA